MLLLIKFLIDILATYPLVFRWFLFIFRSAQTNILID